MKTPEDFKPCADTGTLAGVIAWHASTLVEALSELIGGGSEDAKTLVCIRLMAARVGMVADSLARAHGGEPLVGSADEWLWPVEDHALAWRRIQHRSTSGSRSTTTPGEVQGSPAAVAVRHVARPRRVNPGP